MKTLFRGNRRAILAATLLTLAGCAKENLNPTASAPVPVASTSANAVAVNGVMMQGFYWNTPLTTTAGSWWQNLGSKATELSQSGITAVWLPPAYKGGSQQDVGYGVYDRYDLGEFNQKGTVATRYGTLAQLQSAIGALHGQGVQVYEDMVMNHLTWADAQETVNSNVVYTKFNYPGRGLTYSSYKWGYNNFTGTQQAPNNGWYQWKSWDFQPYANGDAYDNLLGSEIQYNGNTANANETISWGNWMTTKLGLDGYRLDATKHIYTPFVNQWLDAVKGTSGRFAVSEAWFRNLTDLKNYATATGGRTSLFDVPLHYTFQDMSNGNGAWDMRGLQFAGFTESNPTLSVSFVDNHDTDQSGGALYSPVINLKMLAYAYILTRANGYPCVFYRDFYEYGLGAQIKKLTAIRKANAYGSAFEYTSVDDADYYAYSRAGDSTHKGLMLILNDGGGARTKGITSPFKNATLTDKTGNYGGTITTDANGYGNFPVQARSWSVWVPN
ncbi:alpha-amylase [Hymenobacter agri]